MERYSNSKNLLSSISAETACKGIRKGFQDFKRTESGNSNATSLGGTQRLRSYPVGRFHDEYAFFFGLESRFYFMENTTPFNWIIEKGVFEAFQIALFQEFGQISPKNDSSLYSNFKSSSGLGFRIVFSTVILRMDYASGNEGDEKTIFIGYGF